MKTIIAILLMAGSVLAQGPLFPPAGPAPVMRSLDQIEPRTPITNAPFTITQPGSYYLAGNLTSTGHGVVVQTGGVTLDLNGFVLQGSLASFSAGVLVSNNTPSVGVAVRNGIIANFSRGIHVLNSRQGIYENLILNTNSIGIQLAAAGAIVSANTIRQCSIYGGGSYGIDLVTTSGSMHGNNISDNLISGYTTGIRIAGSESGAHGNIVMRNMIMEAQANGMSISASRTRIEENHVATTLSDFLASGVIVNGLGNYFFNNTSSGYAFAYSLGSNTIHGPIVLTNGTLSATGTASHPKANYAW